MSHVCAGFSFVINGLRSYFFEVVIQDLTKNYRMVEEQCCTPHEHDTAIRVGGYRVGSEPSHIRVLHKSLWYNRGID